MSELTKEQRAFLALVGEPGDGTQEYPVEDLDRLLHELPAEDLQGAKERKPSELV